MTTAPFARPIAHRGLHDKAKGVIENSASAFAAAITRGFGIECDLQLTADGKAVVFHDQDLERLTGQKGRVRDMTAAQMQALTLSGSANADHPQSLGDFLTQVAGRVLLVVEIKQQARGADTYALARHVVETIAGYDGALVLKSFDPRMLVAVRRAGYRGPLGIITYAYDRPDWDGGLPTRQRFVLRHLLHFPWSRFTFISCERTGLRLPAIRLFRALGMKVMSWTVKSAEQAREVYRDADQIVFEGFDPDA